MKKNAYLSAFSNFLWGFFRVKQQRAPNKTITGAFKNNKIFFFIAYQRNLIHKYSMTVPSQELGPGMYVIPSLDLFASQILKLFLNLF